MLKIITHIKTLGLAFFIACATLLLTLPANASAKTTAFSQAEQQLRQVMLTWQAGEVDTALREIGQLIRDYPNFDLAYLIQGDMLASRAGRITILANKTGKSSIQTAELRDEARARMRRWQDLRPEQRVPANLLQLSNDQAHAVVVDMAESRIYLFENDYGAPRLKADYYAGIGANGPFKEVEGDKRTPVGVYFITERLDGSTLPDLYGIAAYPVDYPNQKDLKDGRTGSGIWLHGVPSNTYNRAPRSSRGCVTLANTDLAQLEPFFSPGSTPVILADTVEWITPLQAEITLTRFANIIEAWRQDWESLNTERYLSHYASDFSRPGMSRQAFADYKRRVNRNKQYIQVGITDLSLFRYPAEDIMVATFTQHYSSDNFQQSSRKRQYWKLEDNTWRILLEDTL